MSKAVIRTDAEVRRCESRATRHEIADAKAQGLYLIVQPTGALSFAVRYRGDDGKSVKLTLGPFDPTKRNAVKEPMIGAPLLLAEARWLAASVHHGDRSGRDPRYL